MNPNPSLEGSINLMLFIGLTKSTLAQSQGDSSVSLSRQSQGDSGLVIYIIYEDPCIPQTYKAAVIGKHT